MNTKTLTEKQKRFVTEYISNLSIRSACKQAGVDYTAGLKWFKQDHVQKHIEDEFAKTRARSIITIDKTLKELAYVMNSDITDFLEDQGVGYFIFKNFAELPPEMTKAIQSFEQTITQTGEVKIKIRLHPKMDAIKTAAQHLGILMDHLKLTVDSDKPLIDARQQVVQIGFPRMDLSIEEWEAMCDEADRAREAIMLQQGDVEVRDKEESDDEE